MTTRMTGIWFSSLALFLALIYDVGFYKQDLGVNFLVFMILAALGFTALAIQNKLIQNRFAWWFLAPTIALATAPALYNNEFATFAAPIGAGFAWLVFAMSLTIKNQGLPFYFAQLPLWTQLDQLIVNWKNIYHDVFTHEEGKAKKIVWGLVIAFPILLIFAGLLASADSIFADWLKNLNIWNGIWRVFRTLMMTLFASAFFYLLASDKNKLHEKITKVFKLDAITVGVVLGLVNALFGLFVYIQIRYLFGGATFVLSNNLTLAEYARSGFFELVRVLILATILIVGTHRSFAEHGSHWLINSLQAIFIAQIGVVAASALYRMGIYQETYGFTSLRLYVQWFIYAVMGTLVFSGIALISKIQFRRFFQAILVMVLVVATIVSLISVDSVIASENISRFKAGKSLDLKYLSTLSTDAATSITNLYPVETLQKLNVSQMIVLRDLIARYKQENASTTPYGINWSKIQSKKILAEIPTQVMAAFADADLKDKKYTEISNAVNLDTPQFINCLQVIEDQTNTPDLGPKEFIPSLGCVQISETANTVIQAQLIQKNQRALRPANGNQDITIYSGEQNGDTYYRIVEFNKIMNRTTVVFEQELYKGPDHVLDIDQVSNFHIQRDGSVIEFNYGKREIYQSKFLFEKGEYHLESKQKI